MEVDTQVEDPVHVAAKTQSSAKAKTKASEQRFTIRKPEWQYIHLRMTFVPPHPTTSLSFPPDILTWKTYLSTALNQFLGVSGTAIPIDFLHLLEDEVWIRIPREDATRFLAGVSGWGDEVDGRAVGFRVLGSSDFLMSLVGGQGKDLFE